MIIMGCATAQKKGKTLPLPHPLFFYFYFIRVSPHVLPHIKYWIVLPLEISIINKQNSCFCFEMEHHAGLERKHIYINLWFPGTAENICFGLFPTARTCKERHKHTCANTLTRAHTHARNRWHEVPFKASVYNIYRSLHVLTGRETTVEWIRLKKMLGCSAVDKSSSSRM